MSILQVSKKKLWKKNCAKRWTLHVSAMRLSSWCAGIWPKRSSVGRLVGTGRPRWSRGQRQRIRKPGIPWNSHIDWETLSDYHYPKSNCPNFLHPYNWLPWIFSTTSGLIANICSECHTEPSDTRSRSFKSQSLTAFSPVHTVEVQQFQYIRHMCSLV